MPPCADSTASSDCAADLVYLMYVHPAPPLRPFQLWQRLPARRRARCPPGPGEVCVCGGRWRGARRLLQRNATNASLRHDAWLLGFCPGSTRYDYQPRVCNPQRVLAWKLSRADNLGEQSRYYRRHAGPNKWRRDYAGRWYPPASTQKRSSLQA